jgi:hypothetical protein
MTHLLPDSMRNARWRRPRLLAAGGLLGLSLAAVALTSGCGGGGATPNAQSSGQKMQVMATVTRGDLVETLIAPLQLTKSATGGATGVGQVRSGTTTTVAQGQSIRIFFIQRPAGAGQGTGQYPSPGAGQGSGQYPSPGAGQGSGQPSGQFPGMGSGNFAGAKNAAGTVDLVQKNSDGSLTIHVTIAKLPAGVKAASFAMARLSSQVLARGVLLLPTEAISGSGSNTTVQVLANGKTEQRHVVVGKQTRTEAEIVSGLSEGDNVIYTRTFRGFGGFGSPRPGRSGYPQGAPPSGFPIPTGAPSGA